MSDRFTDSFEQLHAIFHTQVISVQTISSFETCQNYYYIHAWKGMCSISYFKTLSLGFDFG